MKVIVLHHRDGSSRVSAAVPDDFDVAAWSRARRASLKLIGVVRIEEQVYEEAKEKRE